MADETADIEVGAARLRCAASALALVGCDSVLSMRKAKEPDDGTPTEAPEPQQKTRSADQAAEPTDGQRSAGQERLDVTADLAPTTPWRGDPGAMDAGTAVCV
jgi:hypothetical protein